MTNRWNCRFKTMILMKIVLLSLLKEIHGPPEIKPCHLSLGNKPKILRTVKHVFWQIDCYLLS